MSLDAAHKSQDAGKGFDAGPEHRLKSVPPDVGNLQHTVAQAPVEALFSGLKCVRHELRHSVRTASSDFVKPIHRSRTIFASGNRRAISPAPSSRISFK